MLFPSSRQESPRAPSDVNDLGLGLQSLYLSGLDRSWNSPLTETSVPASPSMWGRTGYPLGSFQGKPLGFPTLEPMGTPEFPDKFPARANAQPESHPLLDSRSGSPVDSETSGFSSSSDHLCDLLYSLRVSPPVPFMMPNMPKDAMKLGPRLEQDSMPFTPSPGGGFSNTLLKPKPGASLPLGSLLDSPDSSFSIERDAQLHKQAAAMTNPTLTWSGPLPPKNHKNPLYSCKVFLGGVPWDITEAGLITTFSAYGNLSVEWPGKEDKHPRCPPRGYAYLVFESEKSVRGLLQACTQDLFPHDDYCEYYFKMSSRRMRCKDVQVIPWVISDSNYMPVPSHRLDPNKTVFVGALHGMMTAEVLAGVMDDLFGGVVYAGIDTDKHKYPIGSGRVTFNSQRSYLMAVKAAFVEIKTPKFSKKVQIDPYLEDSMCQMCKLQPGPFFCREQACFKYYCRHCWHWQHSSDVLSHHRPLMRNQRSRDSC